MTQDKGPTTYTEGQPATTAPPHSPMVPAQGPDGTQLPAPGAPATPAAAPSSAKVPKRSRKKARGKK